MKVAFIHYHLKPGGVTTVIRQQVEALRETGGDVLVLTGVPPPASFPAETVQIPGLGYVTKEEAAPEGQRVAKTIVSAIKKRWPEGCDVVHVHNPTLAKNIRFPAILTALQEKEMRLLLQIHDFAEDGRLDNYSQAPYPRDCHYAVINTRDFRILLDAGLQREGLHLLPNMVSPIGRVSMKMPAAAFILYPVRAIRRKNIGEAILLSLFFRINRHLAITLPPNSPADMTVYEDWKRFAKHHRLAVRFETGLRSDLSTLATAADYFITTSITEGFGFSFLEPWTVQKSLQGRRLADICGDYEAKGIALEGMYTRLRVPTTWFDLKGYAAAWRVAVENASHRFKYVIPSHTVQEVETQLSHGGEIDFGLLNEKYQKQVLRHLLKNPSGKIVLKDLNPFLGNLSVRPVANDRILRNKEIVMSHYGADSYRNNLVNMYHRVAGIPVIHGIQKDVLLDRLLDIKRFSLLKWGTYER